jgi:hypothetical protein
MNRLVSGRASHTPAVPTVLGCLLVLVAAASCCFGQLPPLRDLVEETARGDGLPSFSERTVPGEGVVDLADFISGYVADAGTIPDFMQVQTADGALRRISAAEAFILLARTAYLWQTMGGLPETIPIAPDGLSAPLLDAEDLPDPNADFEQGRVISTDEFLAQCGPTVRWVDRLHTVPTAVTFGEERLSAADYMSGLAVCIQYAYWYGGLEETLFMPWYNPPQSWVRLYVEQFGGMPAPVSEGEVLEEGWEEPLSGESGWEGTGEQRALPPAQAWEAAAAAAAYAPAPELTLFPRSGSTVSGKVDLVASYIGPTARFVTIAIDGATRAIMNLPPYSYRWDTSALAPGPHTVRIQVLGDGDAVLLDQLCGYTVTPPEPKAADEEFVDDL